MSDGQDSLVQRWLDRLHAGDATARGELLAATCARLEQLTRKMLKDYPRVRRWEETGDVLQNAVLRLCRALQAVSPPTARDYYRLAALQIRRELVDLARHHFGPEGAAARHASDAGRGATLGAPAPAHDRPDSTYDPARLAAWGEFHRQIEALPDEEREAFELVWYQGLTQAEAAAVLGISLATFKRRWLAARLRLGDFLKGDGPAGV